MPTKVLTRLSGCFLLLLAFAGVAAGQEPGQTEPQAKAKDKTTTPPQGSRSLVDDAFDNARHHVGFSLGVFEFYESNLFYTGQNQQSASATSFAPSVYANFGRRKSKLHLDYGAGYQLYNHRQGLNAFDHYATATYSYQLLRNTSLNIQDQFSSSPNGYGSFLSPVFDAASFVPSFSTEILLQRQRITQNSLSAGLSFSVGKNHFGVFGGYNLYRFESSNQLNLDGFSVGGSYDRQLTKWLYFSNSYSNYLNKVNPLFRDARIHRLQVGGFKFKLGSSWQANIGGGVELADTYGKNLLREDANASLVCNTKSHTLTIQYNRGFSSAVGISGIFQSDQGSVILGSRLTTRLNLQLVASYVRGSDFYLQGLSTSGSMNYYDARGSLQFALLKGLIASANFSYRDQRARDIVGLPVALDSYVVSVGLQFVYPSGNR